MKILFIGNSYTYYNDMPRLLEALARENGHEVSVDSVTVGGRKLVENLNDSDEHNAKIRKLLDGNVYDVLFLQEQSYLALVDFEKFARGVEGPIALVGAKRNILYATWGRKSGSELLQEHGWTSEQMTGELYNAYSEAARKYSAEVSAVGIAFADITKNVPKLDLYDPDLSHPSYLGSCLGVLVHYKTVFRKMPLSARSLQLDEDAEKAIFASAERI